MSRIQAIRPLGQSIWLDNLSHGLLHSEAFAQLLNDDKIGGVTSNPAIFYKAFQNDPHYQAALVDLKKTTADAEARYEALVIPDIQVACDRLLPLYQASQTREGYVSLEVSPTLAQDAEATIAAAKRLWQAIDRPNTMIKIPATQAGIQALAVLIEAGININVTLLFSLKQVNQVWDAYIAGLNARLAKGEAVNHVRAVASFFLSRVDSALDKQLPAEQQGKVAIALAKTAYQQYLTLFHGERFAALRQAGAQGQSLLWASTGTKNPAYRDVLYVESLIGEDTVNTVPDATLDAFRDHGEAAATLTQDTEAAQMLLQAVEAQLNLEQLGEDLQTAGLALFDEAFAGLMALTA